jgi:hypothetical protein
MEFGGKFLHSSGGIRVLPLALTLLGWAGAVAENAVYNFSAKQQKAEVRMGTPHFIVVLGRTASATLCSPGH